MKHVTPRDMLHALRALNKARVPATSVRAAGSAGREQAEPGTFRLDGAAGYPGLGDHSWAGHSPLVTVLLLADTWHVTYPEHRIRTEWSFDPRQPFAVPIELAAALGAPSPYNAPDRGFAGAYVGYFSYEFGERLLGLRSRPSDSPLVVLALHDRLATRDGSGWRVDASGLRPHEDIHRWSAALPAPDLDPTDSVGIRVLSDSFGRERYRAAFRTLHRLIEAGDIYQANLTRRLTLGIDGSASDLYAALVRSHPAPFASYMVEPSGASIVGISPELFLRVRGRHVVTEPIKGTRPRGHTPDADRRLSDELTSSEKDAAELVMIVDLMRNDLGRVAEVGSVRVPHVKRLDTHDTLFHLSGRVEATLPRGRSIWDLLTASLPAGSITGAPKRRAMEILAMLEPHARDVYTGAMGMIDLRGDAVLNVAIRTMRVVDNRGWLGVGGGIVADSEADAEFQESEDKARAFLRLGSQT